jgi:hypothetical protein
MALEIFSRRGDRPAEPVFADLPLRPGDAIRFRISAPRDGYFTVLGLDAAQRVTRYVPAEGAPPAHLRQQTGDHDGSRAVDIEGSVILDEMLGDEKVIALLCPTADEAERSLDVARTTLATAGSPGAVTRLATPCLQASASFRKEAAR